MFYVSCSTAFSMYDGKVSPLPFLAFLFSGAPKFRQVKKMNSNSNAGDFSFHMLIPAN